MSIKIYGKPSCPKCDMAKSILKSKGIGFEYIDLTLDSGALSMVKSKGVKEAPFVMDGVNDIGGYSDLVEHLKNEQ